MAKSKVGIKVEQNTLNILGTEYKIEFVDSLVNRCGDVDWTTNTIRIVKPENSENSLGDLDKYGKYVIRHEMIHAMFHESGVSDYYMDETLVDLLAIQLPKLSKLYQDIEKIDIIKKI